MTPLPYELRLLAAVREAEAFLLSPSLNPVHAIEAAARKAAVDVGRLALMVLSARVEADRARARLQAMAVVDAEVEGSVASMKSPRRDAR